MSYTYDGLNRLVSQSLNTTTPITRTYGYLTGAGGAPATTTMVSSLTNTQGTFTYTYDANGNITSVAKNGTVVESYEYDALNQLTEAVVNGTTYEYTYDKGGNLLTAIGNGAKTYTYGDDNWKDKLTAFNGQTITYDGIGNPLQYRDGMSFTWAYGRRVHTLNTTAHTAQFNYNADGYRSQKILTDKATNTATTHYYDYNGNSLICERWGNNTMWFVYDATGAPLGLIYNGTPYYYVTNLQGDITGLTNASGTLIAQYTYDPWGKLLTVTDANGTDISANATHIANINPLRYRGYYYDVESGLYYLLSRYYDPVTQRFVNADGYVSTGTGLLGFNMFAYCINNPVNLRDSAGSRPILSTSTSNETKKEKRISFKIMNGRTPDVEEESTSPTYPPAATIPEPVMPIEGGAFKNDYPNYPDGSSHGARDIVASLGTPVLSAFSGKIVKGDPHSSYGFSITVESEIDGKKYKIQYAHLDNKMVVGWDIGDYVCAGEILGYVGLTGNTTGPHVHVEVREIGYRYPNSLRDFKNFF